MKLEKSENVAEIEEMEGERNIGTFVAIKKRREWYDLWIAIMPVLHGRSFHWRLEPVSEKSN